MQSQWFESFFQGPAVEFWNRVIPQQLTINEVDWLEKHLGLTSQAKVLDVPCGDGRHAIELAKRGHRVTGIDLSDEFRQRHVANAGDLFHAVPESLFEADAGLVARDHDRPFDDRRFHDASSPPN